MSCWVSGSLGLWVSLAWALTGTVLILVSCLQGLSSNADNLSIYFSNDKIWGIIFNQGSNFFLHKGHFKFFGGQPSPDKSWSQLGQKFFLFEFFDLRKEFDVGWAYPGDFCLEEDFLWLFSFEEFYVKSILPLPCDSNDWFY